MGLNEMISFTASTKAITIAAAKADVMNNGVNPSPRLSIVACSPVIGNRKK